MSIRISGSTGLHGNSITLNGALGATTPAAANVTTLSATGAISGTTVTATGAISGTSVTATGVVGTSATGALKLPVGTTAERPTGAAGMIRYNSTRGLPEWYNTVMSMWDAFGTVSSPTITLLVVGGGGSGGSMHTGNGYGGGGGARSYNEGVSITAGTQYTITVGAGGYGWTSANPGVASSAFGYTAAGGATRVNSGVGPNGTYYAAFASYGASGYFGGGGGAGATTNAGHYYAGGLGGGAHGGDGSNYSPNNAEWGIDNTGGGGGGGNNSANACGSGGSGVVLLRYSDTYPAASATTGSPTITVTGGYRYYAFLSSGTFTF